MKKTILLASAAFVAGTLATEAKAIDVEMYGQVNKAMMVYDDGADTEFNVVDNDNSSTRFGWKGSQALENGLTASAVFEVEMQSYASNGVTQDTTVGTQSTDTTDTATLAERLAFVSLAGDWGAVHIGQAPTANYDVTEQDLAGAKDVMTGDPELIGGGIKFRASGGKAAANFLGGVTTAAATIGGNMDNMDGARGDAVRYDTPVVEGFQGMLSVANGGDTSAAVYYKGKYDAVDVKAGLAYTLPNSAAAAASDVVESELAGSVSAKHESGVAGTFAYGKRALESKTTGVEDPTFYYVKLGYAWDAFEVAADYSVHKNMIVGSTIDPEVKYFGVGGQYNMGNGVSTAAFYKTFEYDDNTGTSYQDVDVYGVNLRVKF